MNSAFKTVIGGVFAAVLLSGFVEPQKPQETPLVPVTVCEVLSNPQQFNGKNMAILGRFSTTDEGLWLDEDDCGRRLVTEGFTWPNAIWLACCYQPAPDPPSGSLLLDEAVLSNILTQVRKTTRLRLVKRLVGSGVVKNGTVEPGPSEWRDVREDWAVAYGRLETRSEPQVVRGRDGQLRGFGFGHLNGAPAQLVIKQKYVRTFSDAENVDSKRQ
jgi:hypothetical protein